MPSKCSASSQIDSGKGSAAGASIAAMSNMPNATTKRHTATAGLLINESFWSRWIASRASAIPSGKLVGGLLDLDRDFLGFTCFQGCLRLVHRSAVFVADRDLARAGGQFAEAKAALVVAANPRAS